MTHRRPVYATSFILTLLLCLLGTVPTLAAETDALTLPDKELAAGAARAADQHVVTETGSYVDHVTRQYSTEGPSLSVKMPGGMLSVGLSYEHGSWLIGPARGGLEGLLVKRSGLTFNDIGDSETGAAMTA